MRKLLAIFLFAYAQLSSAEARVAEEYTLKAAYLYNFAKFVKWPEANLQAEEPLQVCVYGENPFGDSLDKLSSRKAQGRSISVRLLGHSKPEQGQCHILFVGDAHAADWPGLRAQLDGQALLSVSDMEAFTSQDGMIGFVRVDQRIKFEINLPESKRAGLSISSFLLKLALNVRGK